MFLQIAKVARILTIWIATSFVIFWILELVPTDTSVNILGLQADQETINRYAASLGLDKPPLERYFDWLLNFGGLSQISPSYSEEVGLVLLDGFLATISISFLAMTLSFSIGLSVGIAAALLANSHNTFNSSGQLFGRTFMYLLYGTPVFIFALLLLVIFPKAAHSIIAGAACLAIPQGALLASSCFKETGNLLKKPFIFYARKRGVSNIRLIYLHIMPHVLISLIGLMTLQVAFFMSATFIVEKPLGIDGMGQILLRAIDTGDKRILLTGNWLLLGVIFLTRLMGDIIVSKLETRIQD